MKAVFLIALLFFPCFEEEERAISALDVARLEQLYHITDTLKDKLWPGFDLRKIPIAINCNDKQELLVNHPRPPKEYKPYQDFDLNGSPILVRDGMSRYGPRGGGWAVELAGEDTAYVSVLQEGGKTESYLSLLVHECFHCFQKTIRQRADRVGGEHPRTDPVYAALLGVESRILQAICREEEDAQVKKLCKMFIATRHERRKDLPKALIALEGEEEYSEGTATYSQARMYQLFSTMGDIKGVGRVKDPLFNGFKTSKQDYDRMIRRIVLPESSALTFFHSMYNHGMALCLVLDRVRDGWKKEICAKGATQFNLLDITFPLDRDEEAAFLKAAKNRFQYDALFKTQAKLIQQYLGKVRSFTHAKGRRYRIFFRELRTGFNWKPEGPVHHVPPTIEKELVELKIQDKMDSRRIIWEGGIPRFEMKGLDFQSKKVPILFGSSYFEWIDPNPEKELKDCKIQFEKQEGNVYFNLTVITDGFTLKADKARLKKGDQVVEIHAVK